MKLSVTHGRIIRSSEVCEGEVKYLSSHYISPWGHGIPQTDYKMATTKNSRQRIVSESMQYPVSQGFVKGGREGIIPP